MRWVARRVRRLPAVRRVVLVVARAVNHDPRWVPVLHALRDVDGVLGAVRREAQSTEDGCNTERGRRERDGEAEARSPRKSERRLLAEPVDRRLYDVVRRLRTAVSQSRLEISELVVSFPESTHRTPLARWSRFPVLKQYRLWRVNPYTSRTSCARTSPPCCSSRDARRRLRVRCSATSTAFASRPRTSPIRAAVRSAP